MPTKLRAGLALAVLWTGTPAYRETTHIVAGGPVFSADPELARRAGIDFVARDAGAFWEYLLDWDH